MKVFFRRIGLTANDFVIQSLEGYQKNNFLDLYDFMISRIIELVIAFLIILRVAKNVTSSFCQKIE